jgi:hypothetical protein
MSSTNTNMIPVPVRSQDEDQPIPRAARITQRLDEMRALIAKYRVEAIALHARLVALELAGNDNVAALRHALIASSVQIENVARSLVDTPLIAPTRLARGTEQIDEWGDQPTLRRPR